MRVFVTTQRSRPAFFEGKEEHVLGYIHIKDIVWVLLDQERRAEEGWTAAEFNVRQPAHELPLCRRANP